MANNSVSMPHDFSKLGQEKVIATGVYYHLIPIRSGYASRHLDSIPASGFWFPVTGDSPVDFTFNHTWDAADNLTKKALDTVGGSGGVVGEAVQLGVRQAQHFFGGSFYVSGCSLYNTSAPPTINVNTKLFSVGGNNLIKIVEALRADTHARFTEISGISLSVSFAGAKAGVVRHPGWWEIRVVSFADGSTNVVADMRDMICTSMKVTMFSPWLGMEPCYMELSLGFQHAYPGLCESMDFGKG